MPGSSHGNERFDNNFEIPLRRGRAVPQAPLFQVHEPELAAEPDASDQAIMEQAARSGCSPARCSPAAWRLTAPLAGRAGDSRHARAVANPEVPAIFEGTFENGGVLVRVDILQRRRDGRWRLLEVKSTTDLKEHHLDDVESSPRRLPVGLDLASSCLMHVNRNYVFQGGSIDVRQFFRSET
jgi:hypothetical protein